MVQEHEFAVVVEDAGDGWFWARSPEVPGANGQGRTPEEAVEDLVAAIELMLDVLADAERERAS